LPVIVRRLEEFDDAADFDCGDLPLNDYLRRHAWSSQGKSSLGVTYIAVDEDAPGAILGYFTLAASSLARDRFPKKYVRGLPPYDLPFILLARLAVDRRLASRGLGRALMAEAFRIALRVADEVGCRGILTDAYRDKAGWYAQFGFIPLDDLPESRTQKMFLDIRTLRSALQTGG
jgi:GNAT superfamily N-acetyltransferase